MPSYKQLSKYNWKVQVSLGYKDGKKQLARKQGFKTKKMLKDGLQIFLISTIKDMLRQHLIMFYLKTFY